MRTTQSLKQEVYRQVQSNGLFKQMQAGLQTQALNIINKSSNQTKNQLEFQYQHHLLSKLRKYPLTSLCLDLVQQFLQSFQFKHSLSVFKKEINRQGNIERIPLANNFRIEMKNPQKQAVLLSLVTQLISGDIKVNLGKQTNTFAATNNTQTNQHQQLRVNNFIGNQNTYSQPATNNFNKKPTNGVQDTLNTSSVNGKPNSNIYSANNSSAKQQSQSLNNTSSNNQSLNQSNLQTPSSSVIQSSLKPSQTSVSQGKQQTQAKQTKQDKNKKTKKKKQVQKPPEGATDLMGQLMGKFKTKDTKAEQQSKKNKIFEQKRAFSEEKTKKVVDPSESGTNKIRGVSMGKMSNFINKFIPQSMAPVKNDSYVEQELDQFQQSKDSTRKNPLYSSSESGFDKSGYYDKSVDSNAIDDFQYVEKAKKFNKKI